MVIPQNLMLETKAELASGELDQAEDCDDFEESIHGSKRFAAIQY
jgi:hypothetical protein